MWFGSSYLFGSIGGEAELMINWQDIFSGLKSLCPNCHKGKIFNGFLSVKTQCEVCGMKLKDQDSGDGPAYVISFILCLIIVPIALILAIKYNWSLILSISFWSIILIGLTLLLLRPIKSIFIMINAKLVKK